MGDDSVHTRRLGEQSKSVLDTINNINNITLNGDRRVDTK